MKSEQWKLGGRCNQCRRQAYCGTECKAHKKRVMYETHKFIAEKMDKQTYGVYSKIMGYYSEIIEHSPHSNF